METDPFAKLIKHIEDTYGITRKEYNKIHQWIKYRYGKADRCENPHCEGKSKNFDWALNRGAKYERKRENFTRLCKSCHGVQDSTEEKRAKLSKAFNRLSEKECEDCQRVFPMKLAQKVCNKCHRIRRRKSSRKFAENNREVMRKASSLWKKQNKDKVNEYQRKIHREKRGKEFGIRSVDKLTKKDIETMKSLYLKGYRNVELSKLFHVTSATVSHHLKSLITNDINNNK